MQFMMSNKIAVFCLVSFLYLTGCTKAQTIKADANSSIESRKTSPTEVAKIRNTGKAIHVLVALCDNENQGIVPVPAFLGNGEDPAKNLYWGVAFGVKTFFSKSANWQKLASMRNLLVTGY